MKCNSPFPNNQIDGRVAETVHCFAKVCENMRNSEKVDGKEGTNSFDILYTTLVSVVWYMDILEDCVDR